MFICFFTQHDRVCSSFKVQTAYTDPTQLVCKMTAVFMMEVEKLFMPHSVYVSLPDVGPAGSVGQCQDRGLIFGQTGHYS